MQTMTSAYAPGRSPFARMMRDTQRMIVNLRAYEYADWSCARAKRIAGPHMHQGEYFAKRLAELETDRKQQAQNVANFDALAFQSYGPDLFRRMKRIAAEFA